MTENDHREEATQSLAVELFELSHEPSSPDDANGMEEARSRAEKILRSLARDAEPTTVSAEQWGLAAGVIQDNWNLCGDGEGCQCEDANDFAWEVARDAFRAAGFRTEGDPT